MDCKWALDLFDAYLDNDLSPEERLHLEEHIRSCPTCAEELAFAQRINDTLRNLPEEKCPDSVIERAFADIKTENAEESQEKRDVHDTIQSILNWRLIFAATVVLILFSIGVFYRKPLEEDSEIQDITLAKKQLETTFAYITAVSLRSTETISKEVIAGRVIPAVNRGVERVNDTKVFSFIQSHL